MATGCFHSVKALVLEVIIGVLTVACVILIQYYVTNITGNIMLFVIRSSKTLAVTHLLTIQSCLISHHAGDFCQICVKNFGMFFSGQIGSETDIKRLK